MRKVKLPRTGLIKRNETYEAKSIEQMLADKMAGETIELGGKALLYTDRKDGVLPETNIRSDRFELAQDALDTVERTRRAKRDAFSKAEADRIAKEVAEKAGKASESTQGKPN